LVLHSRIDDELLKRVQQVNIYRMLKEVLENVSRMQDELDALRAIYGDSDNIDNRRGFSLNIIDTVPAKKYATSITVNASYDSICVIGLPQSYPMDCPIIVKATSSRLKQAVEAFLISQFQPGNEILFDVIEFMRNLVDSESDPNDNFVEHEHEDNCVEDKMVHSTSWTDDEVDVNHSGKNLCSNICIMHGEPIVVKKSIFVAHVARVNTAEELNSFHATVLSDKRVSRATHNIFAFRYTDSITKVLHHDHDDDGEDAAGGRLGEMLRLLGLGSTTTGGVAVIVSRWYGGIKLGPERFKIINNCARKVLEDQEIVTAGAENGMQNKCRQEKSS
jgi:putative IMPACT (imprinted ancient) family translation regulator